MRENNLSGSLEIFAGSNYRGSICPTGAKISSSYREFREIEGSRNRGLSDSDARETRFGSKY